MMFHEEYHLDLMRSYLLCQLEFLYFKDNFDSLIEPKLSIIFRKLRSYMNKIYFEFMMCLPFVTIRSYLLPWMESQ